LIVNYKLYKPDLTDWAFFMLDVEVFFHADFADEADLFTRKGAESQRFIF